jgi:phospholipid/cholesterol/gamma-HCH transport system ATP-binding protein
MEHIVKVEQLDVGYDGVAVLEDLNFAITPGEITVILGKSGCGKSTILKTLIGLMPPITGEVRFFGQPVDYYSEHSLDRLYRRIGVLYQNSALLNSFNLYDNIALPLRMHHSRLPAEVEREMVFARLAQVGLAHSSEKYPSELSGGMRKRAALARAMISDPDIIFCDEPSAGLDPITAAGLDRLMLDLKTHFGMTLVVVTHELRSIDAIADKALVLNDGKLHFFGGYHRMIDSRDPFIDGFFLKPSSQGIENEPKT